MILLYLWSYDYLLTVLFHLGSNVFTLVHCWIRACWYHSFLVRPFCKIFAIHLIISLLGLPLAQKRSVGIKGVVHNTLWIDPIPGNHASKTPYDHQKCGSNPHAVVNKQGYDQSCVLWQGIRAIHYHMQMCRQEHGHCNQFISRSCENHSINSTNLGTQMS